MSVDQRKALDNARIYAKLVGEIIQPAKVVLYGSFAKGNWNENSDIDIAVIMNTIDDYLETSKKINKLTRGIDTRIEPVLLQSNEDSSGFLSTVLNTGITLYSN